MKQIVELVKRLHQEPWCQEDTLHHFVENHSFPLLEGDQAVFFFWDGNPVDSVSLINWVYGLESRQEFHRLQGTHAFFLPVQLPSAARVEYKFLVNRGGHETWMRDPLNLERAYDPFGSNSVCSMPNYQHPEWSLPNALTREGQVEEFTLASDVYGEERRVQVYLPFEYQPHKKYPLFICHDGSDYMRYAGIKAVLDNLIQRHEVMPTVVAFVDGGRRNEEYGANPAQPKFIVEEVLPALEERYGLSENPADRGLMGASFGGVTSLYTAWCYPGVFGRLLLQSGSFVFTDVGDHGRSELWNPVVEFVNAFRLDPGRIDAKVFMSCGIFESLIYYNRSLVPLLRKAGISLRYVESQDGHNWIAWRDRLRDGLTWLSPGHLWMYYE